MAQEGAGLASTAQEIGKNIGIKEVNGHEVFSSKGP